MADIVQRGLNLQVEAEDLASGTVESIADLLEALQARAETVFETIAMAGEDAASALADAANLFAPEWESQFEGLQSDAAGVFADMQGEAETAAAQMSSSADSMIGAWATAFDSLKTGSDEAETALTGLQGDMETTAEVAEGSAGDIGAAYSADALALDAGAGGLEALQGNMESTAGVARETAGDVGAAWDADSLSLDAGAGSLEALQGEFSDTAVAAEIAAGEASDAWSADALALDAAKGSLGQLQLQLETTATDAATAAGEVSDAFSKESLSLDSAKGSLTALQGQMDAAARTAKEDAAKISGAFDGVDVGALAAGGVVAGAAAGPGRESDETPGVSFGKTPEGKPKGFSIPTPSLSGALTGGITAALGLGGIDIAISQLEGLESLKAQTGMSWQQTLATAAAAKGIGIDTSTVQHLISRLDSSVGKLSQKDVIAATAEGLPVSMGLGRTAIDPRTLKAIQNSLAGSSGAALALKTLGIGPSQLTGMSAEQQLAVIAEKLDELKKANPGAKGANLAQTIITELFGKGTDTANLLAKFQMATTEAMKDMPKGLAKDLQLTLGNGGKSMVDMQEQMFYLEVEMSASLMKLVPLMAGLLGEAAKHTTLLADIALGAAGAGVVGKLAHIGGSHSAEAELMKLLKAAGLGSLAKTIFKGLFKKGGGGVGGAGVDVEAGAAGGIGLADVALSTIPVIGASIAALALPKDIANDTSDFAKMWQKLVAPHTYKKPGTFNKKDSLKAIIQAADVFGLDPKAMLSDSYGEDSLNTNAVNKQSHATGLFQFTPETWKSLAKKLGMPSLSFVNATNPYVNAMLAAASMAQMGIGGMKGKNALKNMIGDLPGVTANHGFGFEHPGPAGAAGDMHRGLPFLLSLLSGRNVAGLSSPISKKAAFGRVDQGVDYYQSTPYKALADGVITAITHGFKGGSGTGVYEKLAHAIIVGGHKYSSVYYAETDPLVKKGQRVKAGQYVTAAGDAELGFAIGNHPAAPLVGGLGAGTKATQAGNDYLALVKALNSGKAGSSGAGINAILKGMESDIRNYDPKFQKAFESSLLALLRMLDKYRPQLGKHTDRILTEMEQLLKAGRNPMSKQGENLMLGLLEGLKREEPAVRAEVSKLVSTIEKEMRKATQTHSPSELTARIGDDLMAGLAVGMRRSTAEVAEAAGQAALRVTSPLATSAGGAAGGPAGSQVIVVELDGRTLVQYVQRKMHENVKLIAKFN